jgi:RNA polymerase sigma-70 factor (ECF subfamily)
MTVADPLEDALRTALATAQAAWPTLAVPPPQFASHIRALVGGEPDPAAALGKLETADLYLAFASAHGDPAAIAAIEQQHFPTVTAVILRTEPDRAFTDEVRQVLRHRLFVADASGPPKIASYAGRGPLGGWLRMVGLRVALEMLRARKPHAALEHVERELRAPDADPELEYLKTRYAAEVSAAFAEVLSALPPRQRNILRMHYLEGMTIEATASLYRVHRMTVSRWLSTWRDEIFAATQRLLRARLRVSPEELASLLRLVQTRIDVSIRRYLA